MAHNKMAGTPTDPTVAAVRAATALALRVGGATYQQIAEQLEYPDRGAALKAVRRSIRENSRRDAEEERELMLLRLDQMLLAIWPKARMGDMEAQDGVLKLDKRRTDLLGLDAPKKIDLTTWIRQLAQQEGLDEAQAIADAEAILRTAGRMAW